MLQKKNMYYAVIKLPDSSNSLLCIADHILLLAQAERPEEKGCQTRRAGHSHEAAGDQDTAPDEGGGV